MRSLSVAAVFLLCLTTGAFAATIAEDSFDYATGELNGQSGGTGWTGSWTAATGRTEVVATALSCCGGPTPVGSGTSASLEVDGGADANELIVRQLSSAPPSTPAC